ncbi:MAG: hypothetical protein AAF600_06800 [Bacteroidota bacterium]
MTFEEKLEILLESILSKLGINLQDPEIMEEAKHVPIQDRIESQLEMVYKKIEEEHAKTPAASADLKKPIQTLQEDFKKLTSRLENLKVSLPQLSTMERGQQLVLAELSRLSQQLSTAAQETTEDTGFNKVKALSWATGILLMLTVIGAVVISMHFSDYHTYKADHEKWRFLYLQDSTGHYEYIEKAWRVDSLRGNGVKWLEEQERIRTLREEKARIDQELDQLD